MTDLSDLDKRILAFEHGVWKHPGAKDNAALERFGLMPTRYYQHLNALIDREEAYRHDPVLVKRLRRLRDSRRRQRRAG